MGSEVKYANVTFNDAQNGVKKTYKMEVGSQVNISGNIYNINQDTTINVILPQLSAVSIWDANKDGIINGADASALNQKDYELFQQEIAGMKFEDDGEYYAYLEGYGDWSESGNRLNDALARSNSKYRLSCDGGGYHYGLGDDGYFGAVFRTNPDDEEKVEEKYIEIRTAENVENKKAYEAEQEKAKAIRDAQEARKALEDKVNIANQNGYSKFYNIGISKDGKYLEVTIKETAALSSDPDLGDIKDDFLGGKSDILVNKSDIPHGNAKLIESKHCDGNYDDIVLRPGETIRIPVEHLQFKDSPRGWWEQLLN